MKIRGVLTVLVLLLFAATPLKAETFNQIEDRFAMTMAEIEETVSAWLEQNGYQVVVASSDPQRTRLIGEKPGAQLTLTFTPQSPLATRVVIDTQGRESARQAETLQKYLKDDVRLPGTPIKALEPLVPDVVRREAEAVVCIYSNIANQDIQFSGFIIDRQGWVVCTAHDLKPEQNVTVMLRSGGETGGRVVKLDAERDLTLIRTDGPLPAEISLRNGRFLLRNGDELFAVTCSRGGPNDIEPGFVDGPPRRVNGLTLWQSRMHVEPGSSGSPVFDGHGRLTAVVKGRYRGTNSIGFLIPFETLLHFLEKY